MFLTWKNIFLIFQDTYRELVQYLVESQTDPSNKQRLIEAFEDLTKNLPMTGERIYRIQFRENFEKFGSWKSFDDRQPSS